MADGVLLMITHPVGTAAIVEAHGTLRLTRGDEESGGVVLTGYRSALMPLGADLAAQGGRLPPGAVGAEVLDDAGIGHQARIARGVWIAVVGYAPFKGPSRVRFFDDEKRSVPSPLPPGSLRSPVADATIDCSVCGACAWDEVIPPDGSDGPFRVIPSGASVEERGALLSEPVPFLACRVCGYEVMLGTTTRPSVGGIDQEQPHRNESRYTEDRRAAGRQALERTTFPIYAADLWPMELAQWGVEEDVETPSRIFVIKLATARDSGGRPFIEIATEQSEEGFLTSERQVLGDALDHLLESDQSAPDGDLSDQLLSLWFDRADRERRQRIASATERHRELAVDGCPRTFLVFTLGDCWVGVWRERKTQVLVAAQGTGCETVSLHSLTDTSRIEIGPGSRTPG
jgi:hypothetical protein